jgi:hypothetical protein
MAWTAEQKREYLRAWREANPGKVAAHASARVASGRKAKSDAAKYRRDAEAIKTRRKERYWENPAKSIADSQAWYLANRDRALLTQRARHAAGKLNPEYVFRQYAGGAKRRGLQFSISFDEFCSFWREPCYYCGSSIETVGIDRKDNSAGYISSNVVSCCWPCNRVKCEMSDGEFIAMCKSVAARHS